MTPRITVAFINFRCCKLSIIPWTGFVNRARVIS
uniref:NADH-ubiquinone oxidoreductase-like protein n=1 Tax=Myoviridae sp. ctPVE25 TaxID=2826649 RepID=A0A8S5QZJ8_9CAUD|nr:MAG TPA: NADH-ubiquinone oxidoreductase-like protein [Myoviridae sp. ctPVE25]